MLWINSNSGFFQIADDISDYHYSCLWSTLGFPRYIFFSNNKQFSMSNICNTLLKISTNALTNKTTTILCYLRRQMKEIPSQKLHNQVSSATMFKCLDVVGYDHEFLIVTLAKHQKYIYQHTAFEGNLSTITMVAHQRNNNKCCRLMP